ncbi:MAG TPA: hypothetical protein VK498_07500 [Ferruginibacter sp.]|nr:hypothetical protein [Ferruginibacter sp.]
MEQIQYRIVIYVKDIMRITGQSHRTARRTFSQIRKQYNHSFRFITLDDFCAFTGLKEERVRHFLT